MLDRLFEALDTPGVASSSLVGRDAERLSRRGVVLDGRDCGIAGGVPRVEGLESRKHGSGLGHLEPRRPSLRPEA